MAQQVKISYDPSSTPLDTAVNQKIYSQQFAFKGSYFNLVKLLDSLGRNRGIGKAASLEITSPKSTDQDRGKLSLRLTLSATYK